MKKLKKLIGRLKKIKRLPGWVWKKAKGALTAIGIGSAIAGAAQQWKAHYATLVVTLDYPKDLKDDEVGTFRVNYSVTPGTSLLFANSSGDCTITWTWDANQCSDKRGTDTIPIPWKGNSSGSKLVQLAWECGTCLKTVTTTVTATGAKPDFNNSWTVSITPK